ncbi:MAG: alpha/beta fold hydrolase [Dehalococcoidia bacterium]|nr:alpha/beta fold hydrolase [Dehalococcoidia bacterium]
MKARIDDLELEYIDKGAGLPVVFIHGFPYNKTMWASQIDALSDRYRVVAPDLRGHGESAAPVGPYLMEVLAYDVKRLLDHLNIENAVICGFSMGGYVTFAFYRLYQDRVLALILADTRPQPDSPEAKKGRYDMADLARKEGAGAIADRLVPRMLSADAVANRPDLVEAARKMILSTPINGITGDLMGLAERQDSVPMLPEIHCPSLVIVGSEDVVTPPADAQLMARSIKLAKLHTIQNVGHLSSLEKPDEFNGVVADFLSSLT